DFQCPFCSRVMDTLHQIEKNYGQDVRFVFKQNPLPMHPDAPYAAKASIAAQRQGKFWPMHDKLFEANNSRQPDSLKQDKVDAMAREIGLDMERYQRDVNAAETKDGMSGPPAPPPSAAPQAQARNVDPGDGPWTGSKKPKVTIVEWSD